MSALSTTNRKKHWQQIIEQWQLSGETILSFCRDRGITISSFYQWRNRLFPEGVQRSVALSKSQPLFMPIQVQNDLKVVDHSSSKPIKLSLEYPNGCTLHLEGGVNEELLSCLSKAMGV